MREFAVAVVATLALVPAMGCNASSGGGNAPSGGGASTSGDSQTGGGDASGGADAAGTADASGAGETASGPKLDVGGGAVPGDPGCGKVDFLFVVDNSESMAKKQMNLANSVPGFLSAIESTLEVEDFHIAVVETDRPGFACTECDCSNPTEMCESYCTVTCDTVMTPGCDCYCHEESAAPECEFYCDFWCLGSGCEIQLGAGVTRKASYESIVDCGFVGDDRFISSDHPDPLSALSCALVGDDGDGAEYPMWAMLEALGPHSAPGACNDGFLRDDAILIVTVISDEEDSPDDPQGFGGSPGDPQDWYDGVVAAKHGNDDAVVAFGLFGDKGQPMGLCPPAPQDHPAINEASPRLQEFVQLFGDKGFLASVCEPDYAPLFASAIATIDTACDEFRPEG